MKRLGIGKTWGIKLRQKLSSFEAYLGVLLCYPQMFENVCNFGLWDRRFSTLRILRSQYLGVLGIPPKTPKYHNLKQTYVFATLLG